VQTTVTPAGGGTPTVTKYLVDTTGSLSQVVAETDGTGALMSLYVRADNELLAVLRPTGQSTWATRFVHVDGLGSVRVLTDEVGLVTDTRDYEAFGMRNETAGSDSLAFGFAGEPFDASSQLAYHRARWMDPGRGRFVSTDPLMGRVGNPLSLHRYLYAGDDGVNATDPTGQETLAGISVSISMSAVLSTMATIGRVAMAAAITCEARLMTSFFEPASPFRTQGLCKTRWLNHYTSEWAHSRIQQSGEVISSSGWVFLTPDTYLSGYEAKAKLALPQRDPPDGYYRIPDKTLGEEPLGPTTVPPMMDYAGVIQPGGGTQYMVSSPVSVSAAIWVPVFFQ
jgi:RHS repeat-associated protein